MGDRFGPELPPDHVSRAKTGGIEGGLGLPRDKAEMSIARRQTGAIAFPKAIKRQDEMCSERISRVFKRLRSCAWWLSIATHWLTSAPRTS